jgi:hypothetical protein
MCADRSDGDNTVYLIFDLAGSGVLGDPSPDTVTLGTPSEDFPNPTTYFTRSGELSVILAQQDRKVTESTTYGAYHWEKLQPEGESVTVFVRQGDGGTGFTASRAGKIYRVNGAKMEVIGEVSLQEVPGANGETTHKRMTRLGGAKAKWIGDFGGTIKQLGADDKLIQVGWVGWRKITTPDGRRLVIPMAKSMAKEAKWAGRYDGKLYQDR